MVGPEPFWFKAVTRAAPKATRGKSVGYAHWRRRQNPLFFYNG
ncbi:uncharacterized protein METZ01_LOCUS183258, partial [marine metagenome]